MSNYHIKHLEEYFQVYRKSVRNPEAFWEEIAEEHFVWRKKWDNVLSWDFSKPEIKWFEGAKLNITENCIDRHLPTEAIRRQFYLSLMTQMKKHSTSLTVIYTKESVEWPMCFWTKA